ncbi:N-6 DNA methylase [Aliifodinibius sp. S!AR15-10]|uniref:type ISP restriction/modification enzyme n=1 Tax=Aliifodinibius sp. S!AR15-10 TaxID=2950437 RepID=UPI002864C58A|nr:type ISP restriction/modification enzyme [Aliifodinibius sp. S!AR15-10]MDR8389902.1 N-6 DNA methylase [Aliifodinibius sp. S!AR15-10]
MIESFVGDIAKKMYQGDAREETYYGVFERFLERFSHQLDARNATVTALPKRTEAGNPDFRAWDGSHKVIGYIEAKKPGENLDKIQRSEQLKRYRSAFPNVILTDFFEYRLYKDGDLVDKVSIGRPFVAEKLGEQPPVENQDDFTKLVETFLSHSAPKTHHASSLAKELAKRTRFLEHVIERELLDEGNQKLEGFFQAFQKYLIAGLNKQQFADLYAQTVTYGLFAARTRANETFTRENAVRFIPSTIGILKDVFQFISYSDLPQNISWIVDDLSEILNVADIQKILNRFYEEGRGNDPIIHFYETFLTEYNPKVREQRGVYYTPEPVVSYIVRSVHQTLKDDFDKPLGLADKSVTMLDPAAGTLTFIAEALGVAVEEYKEHYGSGDISGLIKEHLLEHFYAFELMMAPYAIGHLKMGFVLDELGYEMSDDERFKLYLTNTLEMEDLEQTELPGMHSLSEESEAAGKVKKDEEVLVILGNPPYSGNSFNDNEWIDNLLKEGYTHENGHKDDGYYKVDGKPLGERNPKMLQDDYVKFIRFAQWKIDQLGQGVVSMITNHGYLDNPTFRGMRESLMKSFDEIAVLDLHGNYRKKETAPDGSKDENVFDIQQGVAIHSMIKKADKPKRILRGDLYGKRSEKYDWLEKHDLRNTEWTEITPKSEFYLFTELDYDLREKYQQYAKLTNIFESYSTGIKTHRDDFVIDVDANTLKARIKTFAHSNEEDQWIKERFNLNETKAWNIKDAREQLKGVELVNHFEQILYRPFDKREFFYHPAVVDRGREDIMQHMLAGDNLAISTSRGVEIDMLWEHAFIMDGLMQHHTVSIKETNYLFPLYLYSKNNGKNAGGTLSLVFEENSDSIERKPNLNKEFYKLLEHTYGERPNPEQLLFYIYGVLYAPAYRQTYAELLEGDFPRIPFTTDYELFRDLASLGEQLGSLHLMKSDKLNTPIVKFEGKGSKVVAKEKRIGRNYQAEDERVYINKDGQYFEGIPEEVWNYQVGGYQVLDKYLYDRRERKLTNDEIQHYCKVATAIYHTIELQQEIDEVYAGVEEDVIEWNP